MPSLSVAPELTDAQALTRPGPGLAPASRLIGTIAGLVLAGLVLAPILTLALAASQGTSESWTHILAHVLPEALRQTVLLVIGVGIIVVLIGTGAAWLVSAYEFPGRRFVEIGLVLPLAVPTYIVAFAYLDLLHPIGPVQSALRALLGFERPSDLKLPDIRSLPGCVLLLGFVLYPYVYLPVRAFFLTQSANLVEAARCLGAGPAAIFLRVALPLARPAAALGTALALMEALNDVGAAEFLGVRSLTVQVYATWINRSDLPGAAGMALGLLGLVLALVLAERLARRGRRYAPAAQRVQSMTRRPLSGAGAWIVLALCLLPIAIGFLVPALHLAVQALARLRANGLPETLIAETLATMRYAGIATLLCTAIGFLVAAGPRMLPGWLGSALPRIAGLGYALPGIILAIGLLAALSGLEAIGLPVAAIVLGSGSALVLALMLRFLAIGAGSGEAGLARVPRSLPDAARVLGHSPLATLARVQAPLALPSLAGGALLVFVDCMKELPATLLLRPLNVETLATHVYAEAARGTYEDGALAALLIVAVGLIPVALIMRVGAGRSRPASRAAT